MKRLIFISICILCSFTACSNNDEYKQKIIDYLEVKNGVRTDLNIRLSDVRVRDFTVGDSINVLKKRTSAIKEARIKIIQAKLDNAVAIIAKKTESPYRSVHEERIRNLKQQLDKEGKSTYGNDKQYDGMDTAKVLCKQIFANVKYTNPILKTDQEIKGEFIFSPDGIICLRRVDGVEKQIIDNMIRLSQFEFALD